MATAKKAASKKASNPKAKKVAIKSPAKKAVVKTTALAWNTIHIFGYGESQIIGSKANGIVANASLKALAPLFTALTKKAQKGTKITLEATHSLHIFNGLFVDYRPKPISKNSTIQRIVWADVDTKAITKLSEELKNKITKERTKNDSIAELVGNRIQGRSKRTTIKKIDTRKIK